MRSNQIVTKDHVTAIQAIQACIDNMAASNPGLAVLRQVLEQQNSMAFVKYGEEENPYLGVEYKYTSVKNNAKYTYFVGVKGDQFCVGTVDKSEVKEITDTGKAIERFNKKFPSLEARTALVKEVVYGTLQAVVNTVPTIVRPKDAIVFPEDNSLVSNVADDNTLTVVTVDEVGKPIVPQEKKGKKIAPEEKNGKQTAEVKISGEIAGKSGGANILNEGDGNGGSNSSSINSDLTSGDGNGSDSDSINSYKSSKHDPLIELSEDEKLNNHAGGDSQVHANMINKVASSFMYSVYDVASKAASKKIEALIGNPLEIVDTSVDQNYPDPAVLEHRDDSSVMVNRIGPVLVDSSDGADSISLLSTEALLQRRIKSLLEGIDERLGGNDAVAIGNITFTRNITDDDDTVECKIDNSAYLINEEGVYLATKSGARDIETNLAETVCGEIEAQLSRKLVEEDDFSVDDQNPKPMSGKINLHRNIRFGEDEGKKVHQAPYQRSDSTIKTANPLADDLKFKVFTTSQNAKIQKLLSDMREEIKSKYTHNINGAVTPAFEEVLECFSRREPNTGLPGGINFIEQGDYRAFHYQDNDNRNIVVGLKKHDPIAMAFFGEAQLDASRQITGVVEGKDITADGVEEVLDRGHKIKLKEGEKFFLKTNGDHLESLSAVIEEPFHRIAEVDNLTLKAVVSDLRVSGLKLDLGGGLKLDHVAQTDANDAKVAAVTKQKVAVVTKQSGAEYFIVVEKELARVEVPKIVTLNAGNTKSVSSDVAKDVENRCRAFLKKKRTLEWMSEVAQGDHHLDFTSSKGADTSDEEIEQIACNQAVYDAFKESLSTMGDKATINEALVVSVDGEKGGFNYLQGYIEKHFGINEYGLLVFSTVQDGNQESVQPKDLKKRDIDTLIGLMGFDKSKFDQKFNETYKDKFSKLCNDRDEALERKRQQPRSGRKGYVPVGDLHNQWGVHPSSSPSQPEAYHFIGELIKVSSYKEQKRVDVQQRGSQLIASIVDDNQKAETVRNNIVANAIVVAAAKNGLTPAQAIKIIEFSIEQRGFSNMREDRNRINLANQFAKDINLIPMQYVDDPGFRAMAKFSADFQKETTKAGLKREDSRFEEGKRDGLNSSDIPLEVIKMIKTLKIDQNNPIQSVLVKQSAQAIENAASKSNQSSNLVR